MEKQVRPRRAARTPLAQPRKPAPEPRREELVRAAFTVLAERGFEGLRTREVAAAVGINVATLHYYFPTKEALIRGVVGHALARFRTTLPESGAASARLRGHLRGLRRLAREEPEVFAVMGELTLRARRDPALAGLIGQTEDYWQRTIADLVRGARAEGALARGTNVDDLAGFVVAALKGAYMLPTASTDPKRFERTLRELERYLGAKLG